MKFTSSLGSFFLLLSFILPPHVSYADSSHEVWEIESVNIYYIEWDVLRNAALREADVRNWYSIGIVIRDKYEVRNFVELLELDKLENPDPPKNGADLRLVIDLVWRDGSVETYVADRFSLYTSDFSKKRDIDEAFRDRFRIFYPTPEGE